MSVGQAKENTFQVRVMDPRLRREVNSGTVTMRLEINELLPSFTVPESGTTYFDVLKITFFSDKNNPSSREVYHLARGKGTIRFESSNTGEPSGIQVAWATRFRNLTIQAPTNGWFDPFFTSGGKKTAVLNGFFEDSFAAPSAVERSIPTCVLGRVSPGTR